MTYAFEMVFVAIFGAIFGSFASFVGYRLFNEETKISAKRSICCNCKKVLLIRDLVPIFSYIFLRGKCRFCKAKIPIWHFFAEIFTSASFVFSFVIFSGINYQNALFACLCWCLVTQSIIDFRVMMSADFLHIIEFICAVLLSLSFGNSIKELWIVPVFILLFFILLGFIMSKVLKKDCLGFGDIKLFVILSVLFSFEEVVLFIGACGFCGIIFYILFSKSIKNNKDKHFPFIPPISVAFLLAFYLKIVKIL